MSSKQSSGYPLPARVKAVSLILKCAVVLSAAVGVVMSAAAGRRAFMGGAMRLDDCLLDENGDERESSLLSDGGRGAEAIRSALDGERGESAAWLCEFRRAVATLGEVEQRVVAALMEDYRPQVAARKAATNRQRVYRTIAKLRTALASAHELWKVR